MVIVMHILVKETLPIAWVIALAQPEYVGEQVVFKNCAAFTDCISEIKNIKIDNTNYTDVIMPMYDLTEYSDSFSKISEGLWQFYRD